MSASIKVLIVEERDMLREKIAGILSREKNITMVIQMSSYTKIKTALGETIPDLILGDIFQFNKFSKEKGITAAQLCPRSNILLYTDEYRQLNRIEVGHPGEQKIFNVRRVQQEVKNFIKKRSGENKATTNKAATSKKE